MCVLNNCFKFIKKIIKKELNIVPLIKNIM